MEQQRKIDVMIAEACHEEYVDIILETIEAAVSYTHLTLPTILRV